MQLVQVACIQNEDTCVIIIFPAILIEWFRNFKFGHVTQSALTGLYSQPRLVLKQKLIMNVSLRTC
jgi:hypothetical protein